MTCRYCNSKIPHTPELCPRITAVEYHPDGKVKRVEFVRQQPPTLPPNQTFMPIDDDTPPRPARTWC